MKNHQALHISEKHQIGTKSILITEPNISEAQDLINLKRSYIKGCDTIPLILEEYPDNAILEADLIHRYDEQLNSILLIAYCNNEMIGNIDITGNQRLRMQHTAMVGMGIKENWRNKGIGQILLQQAISWAKSTNQLEILWLEVYSNNESAIHLYEKNGFRITGEVKQFFKHEITYYDKLQMTLKLNA